MKTPAEIARQIMDANPDFFHDLDAEGFLVAAIEADRAQRAATLPDLLEDEAEDEDEGNDYCPCQWDGCPNREREGEV